MEFLKSFRREKGLTTKQMADAIKISSSLYEKVECNFRTPSRNFLNKFKQAFPDVDMNIFFTNQNHNT